MPGSADRRRENGRLSRVKEEEGSCCEGSVVDTVVVNHQEDAKELEASCGCSAPHTNENPSHDKRNHHGKQQEQPKGVAVASAASVCWIRNHSNATSTTTTTTASDHHKDNNKDDLDLPPHHHWSEESTNDATACARAHVEQQERQLLHLFSEATTLGDDNDANATSNNNKLDNVGLVLLEDDNDEEDVQEEATTPSKRQVCCGNWRSSASNAVVAVAASTSDHEDEPPPPPPAAAASLHEDDNNNNNNDWLYQDEGAEYLDEDEEEALRLWMLQQEEEEQQQHLVVSQTLAHLTPDALERLSSSSNVALETLHFDRVALRVRGDDDDNEPRLPPVHEEEEDVDDDNAIPELYSEDSSSHASAIMVLEQLEEALAVNHGSLTRVALMACHPKVVETVLWGLSCQNAHADASSSGGLQYLALEHASHLPTAAATRNRAASRRRRRRERGQDGDDNNGTPSNTQYLIWEGLAELLKQTQTLSALYISKCNDNDHDDNDDLDPSTGFWPLLCQGLARNTSLSRLDVEPLFWTEETSRVLALALKQHPRLGQAEWVHEDAERRPTLLTIQAPSIANESLTSSPPSVAATATASSGSVVEEEEDGIRPAVVLKEHNKNAAAASMATTATSKRAKLAKTVSDDTTWLEQQH